MPKNLTDARGVDVQVKCKRGGSVQKLMHELVEHTKLRDTLAFNFTVLVGGVPQTLSLRQVLRHFIEFRKEVVTKRLEHEHDLLQRRLHLLLAERAASDVIDKVVAIIRGAKDDDDSRTKLTSALKYVPHGTSRALPIDEVQAQHILDMALKRINTLNRFRIDEEITQKGARVDEITAIFAAPDGVTNIIRGELKEVRKHFGRLRRTVISAEATTETAKLLAGNGKAKTVVLASAPAEDVWVYVSSDGAVLVTPRSGKTVSSAPIRLGDSAGLVAVLAARSDQRLLLFTEQGLAVRTGLSDNPVTKSGSGKPTVALARGDRVAAAFSGEDAPYYLLVSGGGQIKRVPAKTVANATAGGIVCCKVPEDDRVVAVVPHDEEDEILIAKAMGQVLRIKTGAKLRPVPTGAAGMVAGVKLDGGDRVVAAVKAEGSSLLTVHATGMGLAVPLGEYPVKGRATGGVQSALPDRPARNPAGEVALVVCQSPEGEVGLFSDRGGVYPVAERDNAVVHRATNSRSLLPLGPGESPRGQVWTVK